ncbi:hypothetical protein ACFCXP_04735 [Streptomyces niveus]|uniref:hypothetical protein n=1 Tax=Streptomyces niveus TaxID=193462 RepID=UPI0035D55622
MTERTTAATARVPAPGRPAPADTRQVVGALCVDLDGRRARYECYRNGCPHPMEGPVYATDRDPNDETGNRLVGVEGLTSFISGVKDQHLNTHHRSTR